MDSGGSEKITFNLKYTSSWWTTGSSLSRFFSFSEKFHAFTALWLAKRFGACHGSTLDVGFGAGYLLRRHRKKNGLQPLLVGLDISLENVRLFKRRSRGERIQGIPLSPYSSALPLADGSLDLVYCCHVIEHVPSDRYLVEEIRRILKVGGSAIFLIPINEEGLEAPTHLRKYDTARIGALLQGYFTITLFGTNDLFSGWIRYLGINKNPINTVLKKGIIALLSLVPLRIIFFVDRLSISLGGKPSQAFVIVTKAE